MKKILTALLLSVGILSCSKSCTPHNTPQDLVDAAPTASVSTNPLVSTDASVGVPDTSSTNSVIVGDNFELSLPPDWRLESAKTPVKVFATSQSHQILVLVVESPVKDRQGYTLSAIRGLKDAGARVLSTQPVVLKGDQFSLVKAEKDGVTLWVWLTAKNNNGYGLTCGGLNEDYDNTFATCDKIFTSLIIK